MLFASLLRLNLRQAWEIYNSVPPSFFHMSKNHSGSLSRSYCRFFFSSPSFILCPSRVFLSLPFICSHHVALSQVFFFLLKLVRAVKRITCFQSVLVCCVYLCVCVQMCAVLSGGAEALTGGPVCLDLYYSLPFGGFRSHSRSM